MAREVSEFVHLLSLYFDRGSLQAEDLQIQSVYKVNIKFFDFSLDLENFW